jgi:hypothetical protein
MSDKKPISCERDAARELERIATRLNQTGWLGYVPALREAAARITELEATLAEAYAQLQWVGECLEGQDVSDFAESFPLVRAVADLRATLARVTAERDEAQAQIAEAREACPCVRQQRFFDASLLEAVNEEVSRSFRLQSRAEQAEAEAHALREALAQLPRYVEDEVRRYPSTYEWVNASELEAALTAGQPREPQP